MALRMHKGRVHGNIKNTKPVVEYTPDLPKRPKKAFTEEQLERRRQYQRERRLAIKEGRAVRKSKTSSNGSEFDFNLCPNCGFPIKTAKVAMDAVKNMLT